MGTALCSSDEIIAALCKLGCSPAKRAAKGTHKVYERVVDGRMRSAPVPLAKAAVPKGTLESILSLLKIDADEFELALGRGSKKFLRSLADKIRKRKSRTEDK